MSQACLALLYHTDNPLLCIFVFAKTFSSLYYFIVCPHAQAVLLTYYTLISVALRFEFDPWEKI